MSNFPRCKISTLVELIASYVGEHPNAADTVEGVARWWLPEKYKLEPINKVITALDSLIELGVMEKNKVADGKVIFSAMKNTNSKD